MSWGKPLEPIDCRLAQLAPLSLQEVSGQPTERTWVKQALGQFHYLGFGGAVGENLQYVLRDGQNRPLACLGPVANLDPLARREFLDSVAQTVSASGQGVTVVFSSHLVADLERTCGYLILLAASQMRLAGPVDSLLAGSAGFASLDDLVVSYLREVPR